MKRVHVKCDGYLLIDDDGRCRFLTLFERVMYRGFGWLPREV